MTRRHDERLLIVGTPDRRPYGAKVDVFLGDSNQFGFRGETTLLVSSDCVVRLRPDEAVVAGRSVQKFVASVEGFGSASEAENMGLRLSLSLLWVAVSIECPLRLEYHTPLPCVVYERARQGGLMIGGVARLLRTSSATTVVRALDEVFADKGPVDPKLLMSMELFASARLEMTQRARFIGLVSSLEPIAEQKELPEAVRRLSDSFLRQLSQESQLAESLLPSLEGRVRELRRESVSQAILRMIRERLPDNQDAVDVIRDAYAVRSRILHEGSTDADLGEKTQAVQRVIRRLYAQMLGHTPMVAA